MTHQKLLKDTKYAVDIRIGVGEKGSARVLIMEYDLKKFEEKKERNRDEVLKIIRDLKETAKTTGNHGEVAVYAVVKTFRFVKDEYELKDQYGNKVKDDDHNVVRRQYTALREIPEYEQVDLYKF